MLSFDLENKMRLPVVYLSESSVQGSRWAVRRGEALAGCTSAGDGVARGRSRATVHAGARSASVPLLLF